VIEDSILLECDIMSLHSWFHMLKRNMLPLWPWKIKARCSSEMSVTNYPFMQCHILEEQDPQLLLFDASNYKSTFQWQETQNRHTLAETKMLRAWNAKYWTTWFTVWEVVMQWRWYICWIPFRSSTNLHRANTAVLVIGFASVTWRLVTVFSKWLISQAYCTPCNKIRKTVKTGLGPMI
jgi:hypothetical protein